MCMGLASGYAGKPVKFEDMKGEDALVKYNCQQLNKSMCEVVEVDSLENDKGAPK